MITKMKKIKNKKAILPATVLKMIIAVLCIVGLIMLAAKLYTLFTGKTELEQATESLKQITSLVSGLSNEPQSYLLTSPKNWILIYFPDNLYSGSGCSGKSCLCFCPSISREFNAAMCGKTGGVCEDIPALEFNNECLSSDVTNLVVSGNPYSIQNCLYLSKVPLGISFRKNGVAVEVILEGSSQAADLATNLLSYHEPGNSMNISQMIYDMIETSQKDPYGNLDSGKEKSLKGNISSFFNDKPFEWLFQIKKEGVINGGSPVDLDIGQGFQVGGLYLNDQEQEYRKILVIGGENYPAILLIRNKT